MCPADAQPRCPEEVAAYRILDANLNRALEGLRVVEEYLRFVIDDRNLATEYKQLRHDLVASMSPLPPARLHASRDVPGDVGTTIGTASEYCRADLASVVAANVKRVEQALRSLEEYAKVVAPQLASDLESLRYRAYILERCVTALRGSLERLASARLYVLLDGRASLAELERVARLLLDAGVDVLQLRDKVLSDRELLERARLLRSLTRQRDTLFIMNDRVDLAVLAAADGVHVGQQELAVADARRLIGPDALIGVSTHSLEQARQAVIDGADYLGCGPTFPSATKSFPHFAGLEFLRQVAPEIRLPAFAIGGINRENVEQVRAAGFLRIAVSQGVVGATDPARAARELRAGLDVPAPS